MISWIMINNRDLTTTIMLFLLIEIELSIGLIYIHSNTILS